LWKIKTPNQINPKAVDFFRYVHQKSVKLGQIIPLFTFVWDDESKSKREKIRMGFTPGRPSCCPYAFPKSCEVP
jgi:hypothetical protein